MGCSNGSDVSVNKKPEAEKEKFMLPGGWDTTVRSLKHLKKEMAKVIQSHPFYFYSVDEIDMFRENAIDIQSKDEILNHLKSRNFSDEFAKLLSKIFDVGASLMFKTSLTTDQASLIIMKIAALFYANSESIDILAEKKSTIFELIDSTKKEPKFYDKDHLINNIGLLLDYFFEIELSVLLQALMTIDEIDILVGDNKKLTNPEILDILHTEMTGRIGITDYDFNKTRDLCLNYVVEPIKPRKIVNN